MMAKAPVVKNSKKAFTGPDYFKLPFEVYYSEHVGVTSLEFKSDTKVKKFEDIKIVHREQGGAWGLRLRCENNIGPELYCCIHNLHDEVAPEWLSYLEEDNIEFNSGDNFAVTVQNGEIVFSELSEEQEDEDSEEYLDVDSMDECCRYAFNAYEIGDSTPDYLILDADNSRIKVSLSGFELNDSGEQTDNRIFNPDLLDEEAFEDYTRLDLWEAKFDWVKSTLEREFPKQKKLKLSFNTE
jgi:hypothetical protein